MRKVLTCFSNPIQYQVKQGIVCAVWDGNVCNDVKGRIREHSVSASIAFLLPNQCVLDVFNKIF